MGYDALTTRDENLQENKNKMSCGSLETKGFVKCYLQLTRFIICVYLHVHAIFGEIPLNARGPGGL